MTYIFKSEEDFAEAMSEVDVFLTLAKEAEEQKDTDKFGLFLRAGLIFLATKFEVYLEDMIEEYILVVAQQNFKARYIPKDIIFSALDHCLSEGLIEKIRTRKDKHLGEISNKILMVAPFLQSEEVIKNIEIDNKFNYGKHGQKAIEELFSRIGHADILEKCLVVKKEESFLSDEVKEGDIKGEINAITEIRNSIVHRNKSPNLGLEQLQDYKDYLLQFVNKVSQYLNEQVSIICKDEVFSS